MMTPATVCDAAIEYGLHHTNKTGYTPKRFLLIEWPESQRIMSHPEAKLIDDEDKPNCYIIPPEVWEKYKNTYYDHVPEWNADHGNTDDEFSEEDVFCKDCGNTWRHGFSEDHITQCDKCNLNVCDDCYTFGTKHGVRCHDCKEGDTTSQ